MSSRGESFPDRFDRCTAVGPEPGNSAFFGCDVLRGLVDGIDDYVSERQPRWERRGSRMLGAAMLACSPWLDDSALIGALEKLSAVNLMTRKPPAGTRDWKLRPLREINEHLHGLPVRALRSLGHMAPKVDGKPMIVGPYTRFDDDLALQPVRAIGYRDPEGRLAPIAHAKLAVLGRMWWHDEGPLGHVEDIIGFTAQRLWVSSANFTQNSRRCLEFGYWTEDKALVDAAEHFLVQLLGASEDLDATDDKLNPDLEAVEYDDVAMLEALADMSWEDDEDDPWSDEDQAGGEAPR